METINKDELKVALLDLLKENLGVYAEVDNGGGINVAIYFGDELITEYDDLTPSYF